MEHDNTSAKNFSKYEQKKMGYLAFLASFFVVFSFFTLFLPYFSHLPILNLQLFISASQLWDASTSDNLVCSAKGQCEIEGDIRVHGKSSTILFSSLPMDRTGKYESWKIKPYTQQKNKGALKNVNEFTMKMFGSEKEVPRCTLNHSVPAIVFSTAGYSGNQFHDFSDTLVPLFVTSNQFHGEVQFLVSNAHSYWLSKYQLILQHLSNYDIIDIDKQDKIHCFPHIIVGLIFYKPFSIDPSKSPNRETMEDFRRFLRNSYLLKREDAIRISDQKRKKPKPRLLIISRKKTRSFTNEGEIVTMARRLGYKVFVKEPSGKTFSKFAQLVNSCDVMMGVHGAGLTNILFLPSNAVVIQIVPLRLDWLSKTYFGEPSVDMNLRYLEYVIRKEESTLVKEYPPDHAVLKNGLSGKKEGWRKFKSVYLDKQNVELDAGRFRATLLEALEILRKRN